MAYTISELNGVKIYNLSAGKTEPQYFEEALKKKQSLRYNSEFRNRIELLQDFDFPIQCSRVRLASGVYPPQMKIYETKELSMKCMRGMDSEVVQFRILSEDYSKLVFACADRTLEFHAQYGKHYKTRIPRFPRDIVYNEFTCDIMVGGASNEIYRMSLDEGKFLSSFETQNTEINVLDYNKYLNILVGGGINGLLEIWDYRLRSKIGQFDVNQSQEITALATDSSGYITAVGSKQGLVRLYDLRYKEYVLEVKHMYKQPIKSIKFHEGSRNVVSADSKIVKIYNKVSGDLFTNIQTDNNINDVELTGDNSGLIFLASEEQRIGQYFIPQLGPAPRWCPFLENITEELEEQLTKTVYDEYKFITLNDIEQLNCHNLIGSKLIKPYLHGYLINIKMYNKLTDIHDPFAYEKYKKNLVQKKLEEQRKNRIVIKNQKNNNIQVNQEAFNKLLTKNNNTDLINDSRFSKLFTDEKFIIDKNSKEYQLANPSESAKSKKNKILYEIQQEEDESEQEQNYQDYVQDQDQDEFQDEDDISSESNEEEQTNISRHKITFENRLKTDAAITKENQKIEKKLQKKQIAKEKNVNPNKLLKQQAQLKIKALNKRVPIPLSKLLK